MRSLDMDYSKLRAWLEIEKIAFEERDKLSAQEKKAFDILWPGGPQAPKAVWFELRKSFPRLKLDGANNVVSKIRKRFEDYSESSTGLRQPFHLGIRAGNMAKGPRLKV